MLGFLPKISEKTFYFYIFEKISRNPTNPSSGPSIFPRNSWGLKNRFLGDFYRPRKRRLILGVWSSLVTKHEKIRNYLRFPRPNDHSENEKRTPKAASYKKGTASKSPPPPASQFWHHVPGLSITVPHSHATSQYPAPS